MKEQSNKFSLFKVFTYNVLIWSWEYYSNGTAPLCSSFDGQFSQNSIVGNRAGRILKGETDVLAQRKSNVIKAKLLDVVNESDGNFESRAKSLMKDDGFKNDFKSLMKSEKDH
ncbi:hypothetical protein PVIIG_06451 [Plasmodium vivax India VII]|uniref:Pv-fam-d protein n=2 Tax=Plasmodium vivax TaxID=5855 RepID=A0A0J9TSF4_PLAVI|nr:hypothetical protein PVIIG_06451 [Plasmodium vivax India VII]KMZ98464.1 Pv-fam-d protein [Plasmodium vivax North Korean]